MPKSKTTAKKNSKAPGKAKPRLQAAAAPTIDKVGFGLDKTLPGVVSFFALKGTGFSANSQVALSDPNWQVVDIQYISGKKHLLVDIEYTGQFASMEDSAEVTVTVTDGGVASAPVAVPVYIYSDL